MEYWSIFTNGYRSYGNYLWESITHPTWNNYFYWLIGVSVFFLALEWISPWRKNQAKFRRDFWLDFFYMFFNFFLFSLIVFNAASDVVVHFFNDIILGITGFNMQASNPLREMPMWSILLIGFVVRDFVQWWTHRLLHRVPALWEFHKVHHSVREMGFAAHLRYHWMETIVYRTLEYLPLALLGIGLYDFFIIHIFTLAIGHYNHANFIVSNRVKGAVLGVLIGTVLVTNSFDTSLFVDATAFAKAAGLVGTTFAGAFILGPAMSYLFNSPEMHIWHHAEHLPADRHTGVNFGISLAVWDYLFGTAYQPHNGRDIALGFEKVDAFPQTFWGQIMHGIRK